LARRGVAMYNLDDEVKLVNPEPCPSGGCFSSGIDARSVIHTSLSSRISIAIGRNDDRIVRQ
jgi:hypothetical protein